MVVLPIEKTRPDPAAPYKGSATDSGRVTTTARPLYPRTVPRILRRFLPAAVALLLAVPLLAAAHRARPAPYGDHLTVPARVEHTAPVRLRTGGNAVEAYDGATGSPRWTYTRAGRRPLAVLHARVHAITLWDDGLVTDTAPDGASVRWHRALPGAAGWLAARGGRGVLRTLGPAARMLAVITPERIAAYRTADGDLRWVLPAQPGCAFTPGRAARHGGTLLLAQPCAADAAWTGQIVAVDDLGRVTPRRTPLGNGRPGTGHPHAEKVLAQPR
ncbi:hypothetical protein ACFYP4_32130 [Streptomyces sp. NPDC005551]|uniref:hypothetical protein n=1 Tax=unclassified Streptomyces TaxID=2593676 RepID=UPI0033F4D314